MAVLTVQAATDSLPDGDDIVLHGFGDGVCDSVSAAGCDIPQTFLDPATVFIAASFA